MRMRPRGGTGQVCHLWQVDVERTILLSGASANMAPACMQLAIEQRISNIEKVQTKDTSTVLSDPPGNPTPAGSNAADSVRSGQLLCNLGTRRRFNNSLPIAKTGPSTKCAPNFRTCLIHLTNRQEFANSALGFCKLSESFAMCTHSPTNTHRRWERRNRAHLKHKHRRAP